MVKAIDWGSRIVTVTVSMVVPSLLGYWMDGWLGTGYWFLILGTCFGFAAGFYGLMKLVSQLNAANERTSGSPPNDR